MATLADMKARIASEIARSDLTTQIASAITSAIAEYQKERFRFSEHGTSNPISFNTVIGQASYAAAANADIPLMKHIDFMTYTQGSATFEIMRRSTVDVVLANQNGQINGPPDEYAYEGNAITLYPIPDAVYPVNIFGFYEYPAPALDAELNNAWMNEAERLIRCRAKYELATHVTRNATMAAAMSPDTGETRRAFKSLKAEMNNIKSVGRVQAMRF